MKNQELEKPIHDLASCLSDLEEVISQIDYICKKNDWDNYPSWQIADGAKEIAFALARLVLWSDEDDNEEEPPK